MKQGIDKEDFDPLKKYKAIYERLKKCGEIALNDIHQILKHFEDSKATKEPLYGLEIVKKTTGSIYFKHLGVNIYVRIQFNFQKEKGYIEWGTYKEKEGLIEHEKIHTDEYDKIGNINKDYTTIDYAHVLIPDALNKIFNKVQDKNIDF